MEASYPTYESQKQQERRRYKKKNEMQSYNCQRTIEFYVFDNILAEFNA